MSKKVWISFIPTNEHVWSGTTDLSGTVKWMCRLCLVSGQLVSRCQCLDAAPVLNFSNIQEISPHTHTHCHWLFASSQKFRSLKMWEKCLLACKCVTHLMSRAALSLCHSTCHSRLCQYLSADKLNHLNVISNFLWISAITHPDSTAFAWCVKINTI